MLTGERIRGIEGDSMKKDQRLCMHGAENGMGQKARLEVGSRPEVDRVCKKRLGRLGAKARGRTMEGMAVRGRPQR